MRALAVAGTLESTKPKRTKGGFSGWLGEMQANPHMDRIRALIAQDQQHGHLVPGEVAHQAGVHTASGNPAMAAAITTAAAAGSPAGSPQTGSGAPAGGPPKPPTLITRAAPAAGGPSGSLAQPGEKSLTEIGSAPPAPTETAPSPDQPTPPVTPAMFGQTTPAAVLGQPAPMTPAGEGAPLPATPAAAAPPDLGTPPPAAAAVPTGGAPPLAVIGQPTPPVSATGPVKPAPAAAAPIGAGPLSPRGDVFRTPETQVRKSKTAAAQGDVEGEMAGLTTAGFTEPEARNIVKDKMARGTRAGAAGGYQSTAGEVVGSDGTVTRTFGAFDRGKGQYIGTDPDSEFYQIPIPGFQPRATGSTQTPEEAAKRASAVTTARGNASAAIPLSTSQRFNATEKLATDWQKVQAPLREMERQHKLMETGLQRFREGDKIGGSQAVLVTFQKILDPSSVVRESEYARSGQGLGLAQRLEGFVERLKEGGAGVPDPELAAMVETGRQFLEGMKGWNDQQKNRIGEQAKQNGLDPNQIFGQSAAVGVPPPTSLSTLPTGTATPPPAVEPPAASAPPPAPATAAPTAPAPAPAAAKGKAASKLDAPVPGWFVDATGNLVRR